MPKNLLCKALRAARSSQTSTRALAENRAFVERDAGLYRRYASNWTVPINLPCGHRRRRGKALACKRLR